MPIKSLRSSDKIAASAVSDMGLYSYARLTSHANLLGDDSVQKSSPISRNSGAHSVRPESPPDEQKSLAKNGALKISKDEPSLCVRVCGYTVSHCYLPYVTMSMKFILSSECK